MFETIAVAAILSALAGWQGYRAGWRRGMAHGLPLGAAKGARDVLYYQSLGVEVRLAECDCDECASVRRMVDEVFEKAKK